MGANAAELVVELAHDLRSPLTSIMFLSETLRRGQTGQVNDVQRQQLGIIYSAALSLTTIASDLIDLGREDTFLTAEAASPRPSRSEVFDSVRAMVAPMAEEKRLDLLTLGPDHDLRLGNAVSLGRVLLNLTSNAIKFTETGYVEIVAQEHGPPRRVLRAGHRARHGRRDHRPPLRAVPPQPDPDRLPLLRDRPGADHLPHGSWSSWAGRWRWRPARGGGRGSSSSSRCRGARGSSGQAPADPESPIDGSAPRRDCPPPQHPKPRRQRRHVARHQIAQHATARRHRPAPRPVPPHGASAATSTPTPSSQRAHGSDTLRSAMPATAPTAATGHQPPAQLVAEQHPGEDAVPERVHEAPLVGSGCPCPGPWCAPSGGTPVAATRRGAPCRAHRERRRPGSPAPARRWPRRSRG
jgi:hypothetical protein